MIAHKEKQVASLNFSFHKPAQLLVPKELLHLASDFWMGWLAVEIAFPVSLGLLISDISHWIKIKHWTSDTKIIAYMYMNRKWDSLFSQKAETEKKLRKKLFY